MRPSEQPQQQQQQQQPQEHVSRNPLSRLKHNLSIVRHGAQPRVVLVPPRGSDSPPIAGLDGADSDADQPTSSALAASAGPSSPSSSAGPSIASLARSEQEQSGLQAAPSDQFRRASGSERGERGNRPRFAIGMSRK